MTVDEFPEVLDQALVGTYPALAKAGGGYVWDEVLEYRVWCHPAEGGDDFEWGPHAQVVEPPALVAQVVIELDAARARYPSTDESRQAKQMTPTTRRPARR